MDCQELQALAIDWALRVAPILNCPKLRYLKYPQYKSWISRLDSLEVLNLWELENSEGILSNHPKLHTFNVAFKVKKSVLEELVRSGRKLKRDQLKIFFRSLPVDREILDVVDQIFDFKGMIRERNALSCFTEKGVELYVKHEHEFRDDFFVFNEYQGVLIHKETFANLKLLTDQTAIFRKIRHAYTLHVEDLGPFNQQDLVSLMKEIPNANDFYVLDVPLDQAFFNQLPTILKHLNFLTIFRADTRDYSFLLRFRELVHFSTNGDVRFDQNKAAFDKKNVPDFTFSN